MREKRGRKMEGETGGRGGGRVRVGKKGEEREREKEGRRLRFFGYMMQELSGIAMIQLYYYTTAF